MEAFDLYVEVADPHLIEEVVSKFAWPGESSIVLGCSVHDPNPRVVVIYVKQLSPEVLQGIARECFAQRITHNHVQLWPTAA